MSCNACEDLISRDRWKCIPFSDMNACAQLKGKSGVYVIWVEERDKDLEEIIACVRAGLESRFGESWPLVVERIDQCVDKRLQRITECNIIYIGQGDLWDRFLGYATGGHVGWPAIWALICCGWKLQFCYRECDNPKEAECDLMRLYASAHAGKKPALNLKWPPNCPRNN